MSVEHVEVLVEEPSMEAALCLLLPKMLATVSFKVYPHQGKADLLEKLPNRLRGYAAWLPEGWRVLVVVDRDDENCKELKVQLEGAAAKAGLAPVMTPSRRHCSVTCRRPPRPAATSRLRATLVRRTSMPGAEPVDCQ